MTSRAKRTAALVAVLVVLLLPKKVPCAAPRPHCDPVFVDGTACTPTDLEPFGVFWIESLTGADLPIAYLTWMDCP